MMWNEMAAFDHDVLPPPSRQEFGHSQANRQQPPIEMIPLQPPHESRRLQANHQQPARTLSLATAQESQAQQEEIMAR